MTIYKILDGRSTSHLDAEEFVEYVVRNGPTRPDKVLKENGYESGRYIAKLVSSQEVIDHYKALRDEQEVVFGVVEQILNHNV